MKRQMAWITAVLVVLAAVGAGVGAWALTRQQGAQLPQISVYSRGTTVRVVNLDDCVEGGAQGEIAVNAKYPVQLSVPAAISRAPWRLLRIYQDERDTTTTAYRPGSQLAVTVPTVDPQRGRVVGMVIQLMTLVKDQNEDLHDLPHAEWSVRLSWN